MREALRDAAVTGLTWAVVCGLVLVLAAWMEVL